MSRAEALLLANPFPGLRAFKPTEADRFFGRQQQIDELLNLLATRRLVAVAGASGSGKSSLVLAGLISRLAQRHAQGEDDTDWLPVVMRPGGAPLSQLAMALSKALSPADADAAEQARRADTLFGQLSLGSNGLVEVLRRARLAEDRQLLLVVDQFEELFRFTQVSGGATDTEEARAFVKLLLQAAADPDLPLRTVLTLRTDALGSCAEFANLPEAVSRGQYLVPRLKRDQRKEAITKPVNLRGARIAPRLVQRLLNDVSDDFDDLPVMQHALSRTWAHWAQASQGNRPIDIEDYLAVGGATEALSRHADEAADSVAWPAGTDPVMLTTMVCKVFRALTERRTEGAEVRRPLSFDTLCAVCGPDDTPELKAQVRAAVAAVLERFRQPGTAFLLPPSEVPLAGNPVIDISHESLIRQWQRLRGWVHDEATARTELMRLVNEAERHDEAGGELWRGRNLERALEWQAATRPTPAWVGLCTGGDGLAQFASALRFIVDSQADARREQQREKRRLWGMRGLAVAVLVMAVGAAVNNAIKHRLSRATELASLALLELPRDPALSAHLAVMALDHDDRAAQAEPVLRQAMAALNIAYTEKVLSFGGPVADMRLSADQAQAVVAAQLTATIIDTKTWLPKGAVLKFPSPLRKAWLVADKAWVLVLDEAGVVQAQPAAGGALTPLACSGQGNPASSAEVSPPDGQGDATLAMGCFDGEIVTAKVTAQGLSGRMSLSKGGGATVTALGFSGDGQYLASGDSAGHGQIWKPGQAGPWLTDASGIRHGGAIRDIGFHQRDLRLLVSASDDGTAAVWTLDLPHHSVVPGSPAELATAMLQHRRPVALARFAGRADDPNKLLSMAGKKVYFWNDETHREVRDHDDTVTDATVSDDGEWIVSASADGTARVWSTRLGTAVAVLQGHRSQLSRAMFGPDHAVLTASDDNTLRVWRVKPPLLLEAQPGRLLAAVVQHDGASAVLCGERTAEESQATVADTKTVAYKSGVKTAPPWALCRKVALTDLSLRGDAAQAEYKANAASVVGASLSADGQWLLGQPAAALIGGRPLLWSVATKTLLDAPWLDGVIASAFAHDAPRLAAVKAQGNVVVWDSSGLSSNTPKVMAELASVAGHAPAQLAISPDGRWLAMAEGKQVSLLDTAAPNAKPRALAGHSGDVRALAFSRDSLHLVSAAADRSARVWSVLGQAGPTVLSGGHTAALTDAAFSPDGKLVATTSSDASVRLWDRASGKNVAALIRHGQAVNAVAFGTKDQGILTVSDDGTAKLGACTACTVGLAELRAQVAQRIALDPLVKIELDALPQPWLPWLRWPHMTSAKPIKLF